MNAAPQLKKLPASSFITASLLIFGGLTALRGKTAQADLLRVGIEPIVGYERVQKFIPTQHTHDRLLYGARMTVGFLLLAGEVEYTRATDSEIFPAQNLTTQDKDDQVKLGVRSSIHLSSLLSVQARGGVQAKKNIHLETLSGVTTQTISPIVYKPYAGLGLVSRLGTQLAVTGGITAVFNQFPDMSKNDYQATLGLVVSFP